MTSSRRGILAAKARPRTAGMLGIRNAVRGVHERERDPREAVRPA